MTTDETAGPRGRPWFEALFARHQAAVRAYALRRVGDDADDVLAEVFTTAWRRRDDVPDDALPWLYRTAAHHVLHHRRSFARGARAVEAVRRQPVGEHDPIEPLAGELDDRAAVHAALSRLEPDDRELLRLWAWERLDAGDIAYVLQISSGAARVRLHRARRRMKALLEDPPPRHEPSVPLMSSKERA